VPRPANEWPQVLPGFKVELYASGLNDPRLIRTAPNAPLGLTSYDSKQFPAEYQGDFFACEHGSWNRSVRVGYEVIRVPLHQTGHATGD
jgi:glucose/arabinose dehydrogenase